MKIFFSVKLKFRSSSSGATKLIIMTLVLMTLDIMTLVLMVKNNSSFKQKYLI